MHTDILGRPIKVYDVRTCNSCDHGKGKKVMLESKEWSKNSKGEYICKECRINESKDMLKLFKMNQGIIE